MKLMSKKNVKKNNKRSRKNVKQYSRKNIMRGGGGLWFMEPFNTNYQKLVLNNDPSFKEWIINEQLEDRQLDALVNALEKNTTLKTLIINRITITGIGTAGASKIAGKLWSNPGHPPKNTTLTVLSINNNSIEGTYGLARMLEYNNTLKELYIGGNDISDDIKEGYYGAQAIANALKENKNSALTILHIGNNKIGDKGAIAFADMLKVNKTLTELYISGTLYDDHDKISDDGVFAFANMLKVNKTLKILSIDDKISEAGAVALAEALETNNALVYLNISNTSNTISKEILIKIDKLIERNRETFIKKATYVINNTLANLHKSGEKQKQPENKFFNSLIEEGKRLQNLTLNQDIKTLLLNNGSLKNNKKLLTNLSLSMIVKKTNSLNKDKEQKKDMDIVVKYINSLSADEKRELKTDINKLNIEEVRQMMYFIPTWNYINTIDNDIEKDTFIEEYFNYLDTNTAILSRLPPDVWEMILKYLNFKEAQTFLKAIEF